LICATRYVLLATRFSYAPPLCRAGCHACRLLRLPYAVFATLLPLLFCPPAATLMLRHDAMATLRHAAAYARHDSTTLMLMMPISAATMIIFSSAITMATFYYHVAAAATLLTPLMPRRHCRLLSH